MKYFLELNSQFSCKEAYDATEKLMKMYGKFLDFKLIFADIEEVGISRCIFIGESYLDLSRENGSTCRTLTFDEGVNRVRIMNYEAGGRGLWR